MSYQTVLPSKGTVSVSPPINHYSSGDCLAGPGQRRSCSRQYLPRNASLNPQQPRQASMSFPPPLSIPTRVQDSIFSPIPPSSSLSTSTSPRAPPTFPSSPTTSFPATSPLDTTSAGGAGGETRTGPGPSVSVTASRQEPTSGPATSSQSPIPIPTSSTLPESHSLTLATDSISSSTTLASLSVSDPPPGTFMTSITTFPDVSSSRTIGVPLTMTTPLSTGETMTLTTSTSMVITLSASTSIDIRTSTSIPSGETTTESTTTSDPLPSLPLNTTIISSSFPQPPLPLTTSTLASPSYSYSFSAEANSTLPLFISTRLPLQTPDSDSTTLTVVPNSSPTITKYWATTCTSSGTSTVPGGTGGGVLSSDNARPNGSAFSHNTRAIIGVALAGGIALILIVIAVFFICRRRFNARAGRDGRDGTKGENGSENGGAGSREHFLRQEVDAMSFNNEAAPSSSWTHHHGGEGTAPGGMAMMEQLSAESATMYPAQTHAYPGAYTQAYMPPAMATTTAVITGIAVPMGSPPVVDNDETARFVQESSPLPPAVPQPSYPYTLQLPSENLQQHYHQPPQQYHQNYSYPHPCYPYQNARQAISTTGSDPFGDTHAAVGITGMNNQPHQHSSDALASSACLGAMSSSEGHEFGLGSGVRGGLSSSSSGHGTVTLGPSATGVGASPTIEQRMSSQFPPPSSYIPPMTKRSETVGSSGSTSSGGSDTSAKGLLLFGKLRSLSRRGRKDKEAKERERRLSSPHQQQQSGMHGMSSGETMVSRRSMSMSMSMGHHTHPSSFHGHGQASSLLNPPNVVVPMPRRDSGPPPPQPHVDIVSYPHHDSWNSYCPPTADNGDDDAEYFDGWPCPPTTGFRSSPSPARTDSSSSIFVEGLLNPRMLPGAGSGTNRGTIVGNTSSEIGGGSVQAGLYPSNSDGGRGASTRGVVRSSEGSMTGQSVGLSPLGMHHAEEDGGGSVMSFRDNVDYSRPISYAGVMLQRMRSTTTFGTGTGMDDFGVVSAGDSASASGVGVTPKRSGTDVVEDGQEER